MKHYKWNKLFSCKYFYSVKTISKKLNRSTRTILENWKREGLKIGENGEIFGENLIEFLEKKFPPSKGKLTLFQMYCTSKKQVITICRGQNITIDFQEATGKFQIKAFCNGEFCKEKLCKNVSKTIWLSKFISVEKAKGAYQTKGINFSILAKSKIEEILKKGNNDGNQEN